MKNFIYLMTISLISINSFAVDQGVYLCKSSSDTRKESTFKIQIEEDRVISIDPVDWLGETPINSIATYKILPKGSPMIPRSLSNEDKEDLIVILMDRLTQDTNGSLKFEFLMVYDTPNGIKTDLVVSILSQLPSGYLTLQTSNSGNREQYRNSVVCKKSVNELNTPSTRINDKANTAF